MFKSLMRSFGVGGARVETVIANPDVEVGGTLQGEIHIQGGDHEQDIRAVVLELATRCFAEQGGGKTFSEFTLGSATLNPGPVAPGATRTMPFQIRLPAATPISVGSASTVLKTRLDVTGAIDPRDSDPVRVRPDATIRAILDGMERAGFWLEEAEVEWNPRRAQPLVQEFDFRPRSRGDWDIDEVELAFTPVQTGIEVTLAVDSRGSLFGIGRERMARFVVAHADVARLDLARELRRAIDGLRR